MVAGGYVQISKTHLGCATARNKGTCLNRLGVSRPALERTILDGLKGHLMDPELFKEFCAEFIREVNRLKQDQAGQRSALEAQLARTKARIRKIVDAIAEGMPSRSLGDELLALEASQDEITGKLAATPEPKVYLMPNMADFYRQRVSDLQQALAELLICSSPNCWPRPCRKTGRLSSGGGAEAPSAGAATTVHSRSFRSHEAAPWSRVSRAGPQEVSD